MSKNAINHCENIVESEVVFRVLHSNDLGESAYAAKLQNSCTWAIFSENFSSISSVFVSPLRRTIKEQEEDETNMPPI